MKSPNAFRPWRYDATGQLIPPLPPQPKKTNLEKRPDKAARDKARTAPPASTVLKVTGPPADLADLTQRSKQKRVAELDTLEARQHLTMLQAIEAGAPADERKAQLLDLLNYLATQRLSLRNRFVELTRYEARTETNERLAGVMLAAAQVIDDYKRARKLAA